MWWIVLSIILAVGAVFRGRVLARHEEKSRAAQLKSARLRHEDLLSEFNYELYRLVKDTPGATEFLDELKNLAADISHLSVHLAAVGKIGHAEKKQLLKDWHNFSDHLIEAISPAVNSYPVTNFHTWRMEVSAEGIVLKRRLTGQLSA